MTYYEGPHPADNDTAETPDPDTLPPHHNCDCTSRHCNGRNEHGDRMPPFVDYPAGAKGEIDPDDLTEADLAANIKRNRLAGWTAWNMRYFINRLADTGNVHQCCRELGLSRQSAYQLRSRNEVFRRAWEGAVIRSRDALLDAAWHRAYNGAFEEKIVDGRVVETQGKPEGAMLRYLLTRADRMANDASLAARPAKEAEMRLEELLDCLDPDHAEAERPDEEALLEEIAAAGKPDDPASGSGAMGFASASAATEALKAHRELQQKKPEDIDTNDLDPAEHESWTGEQWERAFASGVSQQIEWPDDDDEADMDNDIKAMKAAGLDWQYVKTSRELEATFAALGDQCQD